MIVVDASVWVSALLSREGHHFTSVQWLRSSIRAGEQFVAPILLAVEVSGAIVRRTGRSDLAQQALTYLLQLRALRWVPLDARLALAAAQVAMDLRLRGADAIYVAVAARLAVPLVTWDQEHITRAGARIMVHTPETQHP